MTGGAARSEGVGGEIQAPAAISVVVPVLDEEAAVLATLDALKNALARSGRTHEIVVVDDGSRDRTPALLATRQGLRVVRHERTRGYGASLKSGIRSARHPWIVVIDADGTYPASAVPRLLEGCESCDVVVGARRARNAHDSWLRAVVKQVFRVFAQSITGASIPDLNSGLRAFRREVAESYFALLPDGFSFTTTLTVAAIADGLAVRFTPIDYLPRIGRSKVRPIPDTLRAGRQLLRLGIRFAPLRTSTVIAAAGALMFVLSSAWHVATSGPTSADVGYLLAGGVVLGVGAYAERRVRRRPLQVTRSEI